MPELKDTPPTYPLKVYIATQSLSTSDAGWTKVNGEYERTYTSAPIGEQTVNFRSSQAMSSEDIVISAPGFEVQPFGMTIAYSGCTSGGPIRVNDIYLVKLFQVTTSDTNMVGNFRTSNTSTYTFVIKAGTKVSDIITFYIRSGNARYTGAYSIKQLLQQPTINLN
ncbi:MAG: hypothetical protein ACLU4J_02805 [Butyricimonas paravirosa]